MEDCRLSNVIASPCIPRSDWRRPEPASNCCAIVAASTKQGWYAEFVVVKPVIAMLAVSISCLLHCWFSSELTVSEFKESSPAGVEYNGAILVCDEPVHDYGTFWVGPKLSHEFSVRNEGKEEGWMKVSYAFAGTSTPCIARIERGETIYVRGWFKGSIDSRRLRGHFEKSVTLKMLPDPSEACARCLHRYDSSQHSLTCGAVCFERKEHPWCIRRPFEAGCEASN